MSERLAVTFVADNPPYRRDEAASFPAGRARQLVAAGVARFAADTLAAPAVLDLGDTLVEADPHAGKRTTQATRFAKKG